MTKIEPQKLKIGLALSGGGVRASVFHLGVLARLAEENLLEKVKMSSTVSGGSLLLGLVYSANNSRWPSTDEFKTLVFPAVKQNITQSDLQLKVLLRRLRFWISISKGKAKHVADALSNTWGVKADLNDIQEFPRWNICATTYQSGKSWRFIPHERMGDYVLNYVEKPQISLADALSCSAAVPFALGTLKLKTSDYKWFKYGNDTKTKIPFSPEVRTIHLWDGGVHDNLGIEPLVKFKNGCAYRKEFNYLIVSDASAPLDPKKRKKFSFNRLLDITTDQVRAIRARVLYDHFQEHKTGAFLRIGDTKESIIDKTNISGDLIDTFILSPVEIEKCKDYKTTLRKMKEEDFNLLFRHGWETANLNLYGMNPTLFNNIYLPETYGV
jgi:NTE family protein